MARPLAFGRRWPPGAGVSIIVPVFGSVGSAPIFMMPVSVTETYSIFEASSATQPETVFGVSARSHTVRPVRPPRTSEMSILPALSVSSYCTISPFFDITKAYVLFETGLWYMHTSVTAPECQGVFTPPAVRPASASCPVVRSMA
jgi:hypothetical protein